MEPMPVHVAKAFKLEDHIKALEQQDMRANRKALGSPEEVRARNSWKGRMESHEGFANFTSKPEGGSNTPFNPDEEEIAWNRILVKYFCCNRGKMNAFLGSIARKINKGKPKAEHRKVFIKETLLVLEGGYEAIGL